MPAPLDAPQVLHALPGRLRVHLPAWSGRVSRHLEKRVHAVPGVRRAEANPLTRNLLIGFDPAVTDQAALLAAARAAATETEGLPEDDRPPPPVVTERKPGFLRRARIAVRGLDRDPRVVRRVLERLRSLPGVRALASPLTGRVVVEYDEHRVDLHELLSRVTDVELPDLPGEDRPEHPLDRGPLVQSAARTAGAAAGLALLAVCRLTGVPVRGRAAATAAGVIGLLRSFPLLRNGLRRLLGRDAADLAFGTAGMATLALAGSSLGLAVTGAEALLLLTEVLARRSAWRRYEERLRGAAAAEPGAVIRLEAGEVAPLAAEVIEGAGTAAGADGLPVQIAPGATVPAGARLSGGPFVLQLHGGKPFLPQPRPAPLSVTVYGRYVRAVGPASLAYAALTAVLTRSLARTFEALLLVNPRTAVIGLEAANLQAAARALRAGVIVVGTRPDRVIRSPDVVLLDGPRVLTDGLEIAGAFPAGAALGGAEILALAEAVSAASGSPWGHAFPGAGDVEADQGDFNGMWAAATVAGVRYTLGPPEDEPSAPGAGQFLHGGGYLLTLGREEDGRPLGYVALRPRLSRGAGELIRACRRLGVRLEMLPGGAPVAAVALARRADVMLVPFTNAVDAVRERQEAGEFVAFVSDNAGAAPAFADCDLAIGVQAGPASAFPARADLLAHDLGAVAAVLDAGARRDRAVRDGVALSAAANVFGAGWGFRGRPGVHRASTAVYVTALVSLADGWFRMQRRDFDAPGEL